MARAKLLDPSLLIARLRNSLSVREPQSAKELCDRLEISQASLSRIMKIFNYEIIRFGKGKNLRYTLKREIIRVDPELKIYEVNEEGKPKTLGTLLLATPKAFVFQKKDSKENTYYKDLPYFLEDLRPSGFLGRTIPSQYPDMAWPSDIQNWTSDSVIQYLSNFGWNGIGNLLVGSASLAQFVQPPDNPATLKISQREHHYLKAASQALSSGPAGSSAGGEQPKFLVEFDSGISAIVKFSPSSKNNQIISQRFADLLTCEHIALMVLKKEKIKVAQTEIFRFGDRSFLEVERFDRNSKNGRRGVISLRALSVENGLPLSDPWHQTWDKLNIDRNLTPIIRRIYYFGQMIHNTDMHYGNLSFYFENLKVAGLAPVYDMLPMAYSPQRGEITDKDFNPPLPTPETFKEWEIVHNWALCFWSEVKNEKRISRPFRKIAENNLLKMEKVFLNASVLK